jgi:hypothetical protein
MAIDEPPLAFAITNNPTRREGLLAFHLLPTSASFPFLRVTKAARSISPGRLTPHQDWSGRADLNRRPPEPHSGALPTALRPDGD